MSAIKKSDLVTGDPLKDLRNSIKKTKSDLEKYNNELRESAKLLKNDINNTNTKSAAGIKKLNVLNQKASKLVKHKTNNTKKLTILEQEQLKLEKGIAKAKAQKTLATTKENKQLQKLRNEKNKLNKATRDEVKQLDRNKNAYTKLSDASRRYKNDSKRLGAELLSLESAGKKNTSQFKKLEKEYGDVTAKARKTDTQLKRLDKTVGDNQRSVGNYANATRKLSSALGTLGIAVGVGAAFRNVGGIIVKFNQAQADLLAISGKSEEQLSGLTKQAKELGETTQFSATEITGLQIELAKLGFTTQQITESTGGIADFAAATGVEIPRAAALAGSALRAFGLEATDIDRVTSTLGVATTKTALDFAKLEAGLSTVAPVAASFGFSIEDTTALLGQLANAGFDASSSATATRNILLNLADANGGLAKELGRPIKSADDLAGALAELQAKGIDLGKALELTDKRSVAAFSTFMNGADSLVTLRDSITGANEELKAMAKKRLNSVSGAAKLFASAWEGVVLGMDDALSASDGLQTAIKFLATNLSTILGIIGKVIASFLIYKGVLIAINIQQALAGRSVKDLVKGFFNLKKSADGAAKSSGKMGKTLKAIGWAALIGLAIELALAFYDIASGAARARFEAELLEKAQARLGGITTKNIDAINKSLDDRLKIIQQQRELNNITAKEAKEQSEAAIMQARKQFINEKIFNEKKINDTQRAITALDKAIDKAAEGSLLSREFIEDQSDYFRKFGLNMEDFFGGDENFIEGLQGMKANLEVLKGTTKLYDNEIDRLSDDQAELNHQFKVGKKSLKSNTDATNDNAEAKKRLRVTTEELNDELNKEREDLDKIAADEEIAQENDAIAEGLTKRLTLINDAERAQTISEEDAADQRLIAQIDALNDKRDILLFYGRNTIDIDKEISAARLQLSKEFAVEEKETIEDNQKELLDTVNSVQKNITNVILEETDKRIQALKDEVSAQKELRSSLQAQANAGNIDAKDSIKETIELERQKEAEIARLEKRKQQVQLISQGLETYTSLVSGGESPANAFAQTVITSQALISFLSGLQGFRDGTENAPEGYAITQEDGPEAIFSKDGKLKSKGSDKGSQLTYLNKGDKVKTATDSASMFKSFDNMNNLSKVPKQDNAGNSYDLMQLGSKLDRVEQAIKSQPHSTTDWENITKNLGAIRTVTNKGGDTFTSKHYVKK